MTNEDITKELTDLKIKFKVILQGLMHRIQ